MSDLIDRDALKKECENLYNCDWNIIRRELLFAEVIDNLPSSEPERTAKVEIYTDDQEKLWSVCECQTDVRKGYNYCPKCGAKLDWSQDE